MHHALSPSFPPPSNSATGDKPLCENAIHLKPGRRERFQRRAIRRDNAGEDKISPRMPRTRHELGQEALRISAASMLRNRLDIEKVRASLRRFDPRNEPRDHLGTHRLPRPKNGFPAYASDKALATLPLPFRVVASRCVDPVCQVQRFTSRHSRECERLGQRPPGYAFN